MTTVTHQHYGSGWSPMKLPSSTTTTSAARIYSYNWLRPSKGTRRRTTSMSVSKYSVNQVEVVTACSWTELVVAAHLPVLVEFWAPWCRPCLILDEVAKEYSEKALCYRLNIEDYPNIASQYGITSIPTLLFYDKGENKESVVGVVPKSTICATLDKYVE